MKTCHCSLEGTTCLTCPNNFTFTGGWGPRLGLCWQEDRAQETLDWLRANKQREDKKVSKIQIFDNRSEATCKVKDLNKGDWFLFAHAANLVEPHVVISQDCFYDVCKKESYAIKNFSEDGVVKINCKLIIESSCCGQLFNI